MVIVTCGASSIIGIRNFGDELLADIYGGWLTSSHSSNLVAHLRISHWGRIDSDQLSILESANLLAYIGGGYFSQGNLAGASNWARALRNQAWGLRNGLVYGNPFQIASMKRIPIAVLGLEVGPISSPIYRSIVKNILLEATLVVARNEPSYQHAITFRRNQSDTRMHLDAALCLDHASLGMPPTNDADQLLLAPIKICLHIHGLSNPERDYAYVQLVKQISALVSPARDVAYYFLHDQTKFGVHPARTIRAQNFFEKALPSLTIIPYTHWQHTARMVSQMNLVITTKLHVGIVARAFGIPVLSTPLHPKTQTFFRTIGESAYCRPIEHFLQNGFPDALMNFLSGSGEQSIPVASEHKLSALENKKSTEELINVLSDRA